MKTARLPICASLRPEDKPLKRARLAAAFLGATLILTGCALPGILFTNVTGPYAWRSPAPSDVKARPTDPIVSGKSCQRTIFFLFSWGNSGYAASSAAAMKGRPDDEVLYDVKCDSQARLFVFGLYAELCSIATGRAGKTQ